MNNGRGGPPTVLFYWDYDAQWGADRSRSGTGPRAWGFQEFENTEQLLEMHEQYAIPACFAIVGAVALNGERPYHDPDQVRQIHAAGHEVASHSFRHDWLPGVGYAGLRQTLRCSKDALEQCIGAEVVSFVPPWNQPFDYARGFSFSLAERREGGRERIDVTRLCEALGETGYRTCRVAYRPLHRRVADWLQRRRTDGPTDLETIAGITCLRLNTPGGFDRTSRGLIESRLDRTGLWVLYGHPHSISTTDTAQSRRALEEMLTAVSRWRNEGRVRCALPRDLVLGARSDVGRYT